MKKIIIAIFFLTAFISSAQKIKVKKGEILVDNEKIGSLEKIKVKKATNYYTVKDNNENVVFHFKLITEKSNLFHKFRRHNYYIVECPSENDTIGIENDFFYLGQKKIAKYLVKNNLLDKNGINASKLKEKLVATATKPAYHLKKIKEEEAFLKNINYKVERNIKSPIFVKKISSGMHASKIDGLGVPQTKYNIYQGENEQNKTLIGHAFLEFRGPTKPMPELIFTNVKKAPIAHSDNFRLYSFSPFEEIKIKSGRKRLDTPVQAIYQIAQILIDHGKL